MLAVGELAEGAARLRFLRLSRLASLIRGEGAVTRLARVGSFPVYAMRKHRISRSSAGRMKWYVVMVMLQEEG